MMQKGNEDFQYSDLPEPHRARTKQILAKYPEVRKLITRNPASFLLIIFIAGTTMVAGTYCSVFNRCIC